MQGKIESVIRNKHIALRFTGKLRGYTALNCFSVLRELVGREKIPIALDLRECTSLDSIGVAILEWISTQGPHRNVKILRPALDLGERDFVSARLYSSSPAQVSGSHSSNKLVAV